MRLNSILLSIFAKNMKFGSDMPSIRLRYQTLSNIYINTVVAFCMILLDALRWLSGAFPGDNFRVTFCFIPCCASLVFLRQGSITISCVLSSICMLIMNVIVSDFGREPMAGFGGIIGVSMLNFFLATSIKMYSITIISAIVLFGVYFHRILEIFRFTLDDEQHKQIISLLFVGIAVLTRLINSTFNTKDHRNENLGFGLYQTTPDRRLSRLRLYKLHRQKMFLYLPCPMRSVILSTLLEEALIIS